MWEVPERFGDGRIANGDDGLESMHNTHVLMEGNEDIKGMENDWLQ